MGGLKDVSNPVVFPHPSDKVIKNFFSPSLTERPNKLERLSLENLLGLVFCWYRDHISGAPL
jgi:hypothetical protein